MAFLFGRFVDGNGRPAEHTRTYVTATRDPADTIHFDVEGVGRGSVRMHGSTGTGSFTTRANTVFVLTVETQRNGALSFRLRHRRKGPIIAEGSFTDIPP